MTSSGLEMRASQSRRHMDAGIGGAGVLQVRAAFPGRLMLCLFREKTRISTERLHVRLRLQGQPSIPCRDPKGALITCLKDNRHSELPAAVTVPPRRRETIEAGREWMYLAGPSSQQPPAGKIGH